jgi:hypothetical protein
VGTWPKVAPNRTNGAAETTAVPQAVSVPLSPRVEIAPGIFAESVVKRDEADPSEPYEIYQVTGGVFDHFELDLNSLATLVGVLSSSDGDELRSWADEPLGGEDEAAVQRAFAAHRTGRGSKLDRGHRRSELELPSPAGSAAAHRRFLCDAGASRRARIWLAETLGDCLPDTEWSMALLEQSVLQASQLVAEAVASGASAVLVTLEIEGRQLSLTRFDEFMGGEQAVG